MSTPAVATLSQGQKLLDLVKGATSQEIQNLLANGDLAKIMLKTDLSKVDRSAFRALLMPTPAAFTWYVSPGRQLNKARQLWPNAILPEPPKEFTPATASEVLLLHVPDTFDNLWSEVDAPKGYTKFCQDNIKSDKRNLRLAPNVPNRTEPVWLAFDPEHGKGKRPSYFWGQADIAASEVFSAMIQFPDWSLSWFNGASAPNLAGYQIKYDGKWSHVPQLTRWDCADRQLLMYVYWAGYDGHSMFASPSVRVLN